MTLQQKHKKYFILGDIHGNFNAMLSALNSEHYVFSPENQIISCGDIFNRGKHSIKVWNFLRANNAIVVKGNHEVDLQDAIERGKLTFKEVLRGFSRTIKQYKVANNISGSRYSTKELRNTPLHKWLEKLPFYFEHEEFIVLHAGTRFTAPLKDPYRYMAPASEVVKWENYTRMNTKYDFLRDTGWEYLYRPEHFDNKTVFFGHWWTSRFLGGRRGRIFKNAELKVVGLDISNTKQVGIFVYNSRDTKKS